MFLSSDDPTNLVLIFSRKWRTLDVCVSVSRKENLLKMLEHLSFNVDFKGMPSWFCQLFYITCVCFTRNICLHMDKRNLLYLLATISFLDIEFPQHLQVTTESVSFMYVSTVSTLWPFFKIEHHIFLALLIKFLMETCFLDCCMFLQCTERRY